MVNEVNGSWHTAIEVPGTATLNKDGNAWATSVSCASAGNCAAGGHHLDGSGQWQGFAASEVNGSWHTAIQVPGTATLNQGGYSRVLSMSCRSAGNCGAGGFYLDYYGHWQAFTVSQVNGTWQPAIEVPGTATLNQGGYAQVKSVSCGSAGNCSAGGVYTDSSQRWQAFVASES